jgi:dinuclear metal center YbgI/SA1388 family protein
VLPKRNSFNHNKEQDSMISRAELCEYLDTYLQHDLYRKDISQNGLQVEGAEQIHKIAYAVDARAKTFEQAIARGAQILLVHHGLYWGRPILLRGHHYERFRLLIEHKLGLYASHLPLDAHPTVGNNAVLANKLGLESCEPWSQFKGMTIGLQGEYSEPRAKDDVVALLTELVSPVDGTVQCFGAGPDKIKRVGVVTGDAASQLEHAAATGLDMLITGEPCHVTAAMAEELGAYLVTAGHYATETFGVTALAAHLTEQFDVETEFIHVPTFA